MTDGYGRKHQGLEIKEKHSRGERLRSLLLKLFNWHGWLLIKRIPKKLPSAERLQAFESDGKDENVNLLPQQFMARQPDLQIIPDEEDGNSAAITRTNDSYNIMQTIPTEDGIYLQKPGVIAQLMGLDYLPCASSRKGNREARRQTIERVAQSDGRRHKSMDVNLIPKVIEKTSKNVTVNSQLRQRQLSHSLDINLQRISKLSFLSFASKPLRQREDFARVSSSKGLLTRRSRSNLAPSKPGDRMKSMQKNSQRKGATLLLEAAVKTLEPSFKSGDHDRPVLVQALTSRTDPVYKSMLMEKLDTDKRCQNHTTEQILRKSYGFVKRQSHNKVPLSLAQKEGKYSSLHLPHQESQIQKIAVAQAKEDASDHYHRNDKDVCAIVKKGHDGLLGIHALQNNLNLKSKIENEGFTTSQQFRNQPYHENTEDATAYDTHHVSGHEKISDGTISSPSISSKSEIAITKLSQFHHEGYKQIIPFLKLQSDQNLESTPQSAEISQFEKVSSLKVTIKGKDRRFEHNNKEILNWKQEENVVRGASIGQTVQEKRATRRALAEFPQQSNAKFSNTKHNSLLETSIQRHLRNLCESIPTSERTDEQAAPLASCTEQRLFRNENRSAVSEELIEEIGPLLPTEPKESWKLHGVDKAVAQDISKMSSFEGQSVDDNSLNDEDSLGFESDNLMTRRKEAVFRGRSTEQSQHTLQILRPEIQLQTAVNLCTEHEHKELPYGKVPGSGLTDDDLEDILRGMLCMTIASDSSNKKEHQNDDHLPKEISKDFSASNYEFDGRAENKPEDAQAPTPSLEMTCNLSDNTATTPKSADSGLNPDKVEENGHPSPVSVLELPFEDKEMCSSWREHPFTPMQELHTRRALVPTDNNNCPSTYKRNLLGDFNTFNKEMARQAIVNNLKQHFCHLFPDEEKENNEMEYLKYKAGEGKVTDDFCPEKLRLAQHQQLHQFATPKTRINRDGHLSIPSEAWEVHDKLLFDCAKEVLSPKLSFLEYADIWSQPSFFELTNLGRQFIDEACKQLTLWHQLNLSTINDLVDRDLSMLAENWTDFKNETKETGVKLESIIFNATLDEVVYDLFTSYTISSLKL